MPDKIRLIEEKEKEKCNSCTVITLSKDVYKPNYTGRERSEKHHL